MKPDFVDNRDGNLLSKALNSHMEWLRQTYKEPVDLSIASGYFNPSGFSLVADELELLPKVRLLLGAEPTALPSKKQLVPGQPRGVEYEKEAVLSALKAHTEGLETDRNLLGFTREVDTSVKRLLEYLNSAKVEVRRYEKGFLHGKAYIFSTDEGVLVGSSNFTGAGLTSNLELNLGRYDPRPVEQVRKWYDDLWEESECFDLAAIYQARFEPYDPYLIYLKVLWELYGDEVGEEALDGVIRLTAFQKDGLFRARRILDKYNGVIFADGVGLGKTFIGGELIREAVREKRQRALLIAPAALRDGTWQRFSDRYQLYLECISYEELLADPQLGGNGIKSHLQDYPERYALIVIDEAHAFRNPDTRRARALRRLLQGDPPKKLVLLTATPVNNSLWDLYYLLMYFVGHDAVFADKGIISLKRRFDEAMGEDPYDLSPDVLFDVLDPTVVRRTRHFVKKYYPHDTIRGPDGEEILIRFPRPQVKAVNYNLQEASPSLLPEFAKALAPEDGPPELSMARYAPTQFLRDDLTDEQRTMLVREMAIVGLLRSSLLKRLESSAHSFAETLYRMIQNHNHFLQALKLGWVPKPEALVEWESLDSDEAFLGVLDRTESEPISQYDADALRDAVEGDISLLRRFEVMARGIGRDEDPKLKQLRKILVSIAKKAEKEGRTTDEVRNKRKVIVFSYFKDTIDWIEAWLRNVLETDKDLSCYRERMISVAGTETSGGISRVAAIFGFAPTSTEAPPGRDEDLFDVLLTTDVLAEGQNLQQCRNIVNYDLPWNPMRLVQRHGRIDRIGSPHTEVFIWCFFPDQQLDLLLGLEERIRQKLAQAAASVGVETEIIPQGATSEVVYAETRKEVEALRREDPSIFEDAGEDPHAHSGEEYRQDLRRGVEVHGETIKGLAWAVGSGFKSELDEKGYMFCARVGDRPFLRFVPSDLSEPIRDTLQCLKRITCEENTERELDEELLGGVYDAWELAREDIYTEWTLATDPKNLQPKVRRLFRLVAEHLRQHPPSGMSPPEVDEVIDTIEAPWGVRIERQIRSVFNDEHPNPVEKSNAVVDIIHELGLRPFIAPKPLPPIEEDEVALVCWMIVK